jgi:hypothetical protein
MDKKYHVPCECEGGECKLEVLITEATLNSIGGGQNIVADGCKTSLPKGAKLIQKNNGFKVYLFPN